MSVGSVARSVRNAIKLIASEMDVVDHRLTTDEVKAISCRTVILTCHCGVIFFYLFLVIFCINILNLTRVYTITHIHIIDR